MGGGETTTQQQSQNASTTSNPWDKAQPLLTSIIGSLQGQSTTPTTNQTNAAGNLVTAANGIPDLSGAQTSAVKGMLSGDPTGMLRSGYNSLDSRLSGTANGANLDPMSNPAMRGWLDTIKNDATNSTDGAFAAAGRDLSPANSMATARGITQGEAPVLAGQYNTNVSNMMDAAKTLYGANSGTAGAITGNTQAGLADSAALPGMLTAPAQAQAAAANTQAQLPLTVIQQLEQLGIPLASLGGTSSSTGNSTGTTTKQTNPISNIVGGLLGTAGILGKIGNPLGWLSGGSGGTGDGSWFGQSSVGGAPLS